MNRSQQIAAAAAVAGALALGAFLATRQMPDAQGGTCTVSTARGPCDAAKLLSADLDDCDGGMVYRWVEQRFDPDAGEAAGSLPPGFVAVPDSTREVPCASLRRPTKALAARKALASDCVVGEWARDGATGVGKCCEPGCACRGRCVLAVEVVIAGADDTADRLCEAMPETCPDGGP